MKRNILSQISDLFPDIEVILSRGIKAENKIRIEI